MALRYTRFESYFNTLHKFTAELLCLGKSMMGRKKSKKKIVENVN